MYKKNSTQNQHKFLIIQPSSITIVKKNYKLTFCILAKKYTYWNTLTTLLTNTVVIYATFFTNQRKVLDLIPNNTAVLSLSAGGIQSDVKLWSLEEFTGKWRESKKLLQVVPRVTKRGKNVNFFVKLLLSFLKKLFIKAIETYCLNKQTKN